MIPVKEVDREVGREDTEYKILGKHCSWARRKGIRSRKGP
jgi:hypothetical protein